MSTALDLFSPFSRAWFASAFAGVTEVQERGWPEIASGRHTLLCAPTGSGKTLAAFFWCLDRLVSESAPEVAEHEPAENPSASGASRRGRTKVPGGCRVLYISPLKALAFDVERNLRAPLAGLRLEALRRGVDIPEILVGLRTGDTPSEERRKMQRRPPDVLITTPESLFLILTSAARVMLGSVRWVIVDEIHTMASSKRGAHLAVSLERLSRMTADEPQRIGLSATIKPLDQVARYLGGRREVSIVDAGSRKALDVQVVMPSLQESQIGTGQPADIAPEPISPRIGSSNAGDGHAATTQSRGVPAIGITTEIARSRRWAEGQRDSGEQTPAGSSGSIWPSIYPRVLELVRLHSSTIIFVNSRRMAERMAAKLNELAGEELVRAHHGSIAREQRLVIEDLLKAGRLPALVATSSLELGIDMGAVDLVIQVGSPTTAARGIQRIGRAGHSVGQPSTGVIFPTHRSDLLETATLTERMLNGVLETTRLPRNPLDVLAQQIVSMCALDEWRVEDLRRTVMGSFPFLELGNRAFDATLDMLDGRYPSDEFAELRPRIVWDRIRGTVRGRSGSQRLAVTSGGTIPDRGLFTVNLFDGAGGSGKRVGELDEEMVYELRVGETFVLGATTWKTVEITQSQVRVLPAPGEAGKITFWHGDALGRPAEVGAAVGALTRELLAAPEVDAARRLVEGTRADEQAAANLLGYLKDQAAATGSAPDDRTIVVERFRDQIGDWRVCVETPHGSPVHAPWSLAVAARLQERLGLEVQSIYGDDGFALRLVNSETVPSMDELFLDPDEVREAVTAQLHGSAVFASRFRENAARALLLPKLRPGSRTPLWLQRQRSADLLRIAARYPEFPILAETYRECLTEVFDLEALRELMARVRSRRVRVVDVETPLPSPFASSLVFDYIAQYMYEGDAPLAERRAQALTLDRELLAELLGSEELSDLLDPDAVDRTELDLQGLVPERFPRDVDEAVDLLRRLGDLSDEEAESRGIRRSWLEQAQNERRVVRVRIAGHDRWIAGVDAALYRDGLGISLPQGLPDAFLHPSPEATGGLLRRWARTHTPFVPEEPAKRWGLPESRVQELLTEAVECGDLLSGQFGTPARRRQFASPEVLRTLRRRSLAALRREVEPVPAIVLSRFLPEWQGVGASGRGVDRLIEIIGQIQGAGLPVSSLERDVISARMSDYAPQMLDGLVASGQVVWIGRGRLGLTDGRVALYFRNEVGRLAPSPASAGSDRSDVQLALLDRLSKGSCFFADLLGIAGWQDSEAVLDQLWELVWDGLVTNDMFSPLRFVGPSRRTSRRGLTRLGPPRSHGRWSLVADSSAGGAENPTGRLHGQAEMLLQRYGVVMREHAQAEAMQGGFVGLYPVLRAMEESGRLRRGYFVEGLGGAQFALPGAVDRLRELRDGGGGVVALAATDPANCYGVTVSWPEMAGRPARAAGCYVILDAGDLRLFVERGGRSLLTHGGIELAHVNALQAIAARRSKLEVHSVDGVPVQESALRMLLQEAGFGPTHRGLVLYLRQSGRRLQ